MELMLSTVGQMSTTMIDDKGRIRIPSSVRDALNLKSGDQLSVEIVDNTISLKVTKADVRNDPMFKDFINPAHIQRKLASRKVLESLEAELWQGS
jgi:AbrB family looped-hinge helix DNA binding protein